MTFVLILASLVAGWYVAKMSFKKWLAIGHGKVVSFLGAGSAGLLVFGFLSVAVFAMFEDIPEQPEAVQPVELVKKQPPTGAGAGSAVSTPKTSDLAAMLAGSFTRGERTTLNGERALTFYFVAEEERFLELVLTVKTPLDGERIRLSRRDEWQYADARLYWDGSTYVLSAKHPTHFEFAAAENEIRVLNFKLVDVGKLDTPTYAIY